MRITIFTIGTEGDVRPLVALGLGLQRAGHQVTVATGQTSADLVTTNGLSYAPLSGDFRAWMQQDKTLEQRGLATFSMIRKFQAQLKQFAAAWPEEGLEAAKGAELLIGNGMVFLLAAALAERLKLPVVETQVVPTLPSDMPPLMPLPAWMYRLPPQLNRMLGRLSRRAVWQVLKPAYQDVVRPGLGLSPYRGSGPLVSTEAAHLRLFGYSPLLVKPPSNWPDNVVVTGSWTLEAAEDYTPSPELAAFLSSGSPPIYVGFGSMFSNDAQALTDIIVETAEQTDRRFILATGWGGLEQKDIGRQANVHFIHHVPHDWLFPRMALAIHHGGAGTTIAATRAGIPSIVTPVFGDQPFWASRLNRLGVAPAAIPRESLTPERLAQAIAAAERPDAKARAAALGQRLHAEAGVVKAIASMRDFGLLPS